MSTLDVPGSRPSNNDTLRVGCWGEHEDGSLIFVKGVDENSIVIFELYDFKAKDHPVYYSHALYLKDFEETFSYDPKKVGKLNLKWTWHDKTAFVWDKVMKIVKTPIPIAANVSDTVSAAQRVAESLQMRLAGALDEAHLLEEQGIQPRKGGAQARSILDRLKSAMQAFAD